MKAYLILILFSINVIYSSYIKIPFKNQRSIYSLSNSATSDLINDYLLEGDITIDIKIGSEKQIIPMSLNIDKKYIYITSNSLSIGIYDKDKSTTFNTNKETPFSDFSYFKKGLYCNDTFLFDYEQNIKGDNISFILTTEMSEENEYRKGLIGLQIVSYKKEETLINQLKKKNLIDKYYHFMIFTKEDEGFFIIGEQPHEYDSIKYSFSNLRQVNTKDISWELYINNINYGETEFQSKNFYLNFNFGFISVGVNVKNEFYNDFFKERINSGLCQEVLYKEYYIYSCIDDNKKVKFNELKNFHFYSYELEHDFIFDYNDLFTSYNNRKYFLITYKINSLINIFGKPFFKKYLIVLNPDNKQIGHYIKINQPKEKNESNYKKTLFFIFIIFALIAIIIFLGSMINKILKRKKRKNELDENFDYIPDETDNTGIN